MPGLGWIMVGCTFPVESVWFVGGGGAEPSVDNCPSVSLLGGLIFGGFLGCSCGRWSNGLDGGFLGINLSGWSCLNFFHFF